jgi:hypothetical protein
LGQKVHDCVPIVHATNNVSGAAQEKKLLRCRGFPGVDVRNNANIPNIRNR